MMSKKYRFSYHGYRALWICLIAVAVLFNGICGYLSYMDTLKNAEDAAAAESDPVIVVYRVSSEDNKIDYLSGLHQFYNSIFSQVSVGEPIRLSMPAAYGEGIVRSAVPTESGAMTEQRDLSAFWVRCEKVSALWSDDNTPSYGPDWSATFYEYRVSVKEALYASAEESEYRELCIRSLINLDQDAAIMKEGREYLIWGSTRRDEDGSVIMSLTNSDTSFSDAVRLSGDSVLYQNTGTLPIVSEVSDGVEAFLNTENGKLWREKVFPMIEISRSTLRVLGTPGCSFLYGFDTGLVTPVEGRLLSSADHEEGNAVCMVSEELAHANGWSVGSTVKLSFYQTQYRDHAASPYPGYYDPYRGFREEGEYRIVGIYHTEDWAGNSYGVHPDTVILPQGSLKYTYYQHLPAAMYYAVLTDEFDDFCAELKDLTVYERFLIPPREEVISEHEPMLSEPDPVSTLRSTWRIGNMILLCAVVLLILIPPIFLLLRHRRTVGAYIRDILSYVGKRLIREPMSGLLSCLLVLAVAFLLMIMQSRMENQLAQLDRTYEQYPILCTVSDATGAKTEGLQIPSRLVRMCTEENGRLYPYVKDLILRNETRYLALMVTGGMTLAGNTADETPAQTVYGINCLAAEDRLSHGSVTFLEGYGEEDLRGDHLVCLIPQREGNVPSTVTLYWEKNEYIRLRVIGTYASSATDSLYCPFLTVSEWISASGGIPSAERMSFTVADNRRLNECKKEMSRYFLEASHHIDPEKLSELALIVDDTLFTETVYVLERGILLFRLMIVMLCVLSIGVSFLAAFLAIRGRRTEFAVMCSLGKSRVAVYITALLEHLVFFVVGMLLALLLHRVVFDMLPSMLCLPIFLICYVAGVTIAILQATWGKIIQVLKGNE